MHSNTTQTQGFSLVELSVVLIILGLLAAGITAGNSLVKGSKLRAVIAEVESFRTAVNAFVVQYDELPGDITNAHDYWDDGADGVCGNATQCNGDGDGLIEIVTNVNNNESYRAWQHLTLADLVPGNYTGIAYGTGKQADIGVNVPASKLTGGGYTMTYKDLFTDGRVVGNAVSFGAFRVNSSTWNSVISAKDAYSIDKKIDDGGLESGKVGIHRGADAGGQCFTGSAGSRVLTLSDTGIKCRMLFLLQ